MNWTDERIAHLEKFSFGDSPRLADELLALVLSGAKKATCGAYRDYQKPNAPPRPKVGRCDVVLDGKGAPACIIETTEVTIKNFCDVDEDFAVSEGEGPYEVWREAHVAYFSRNGGFSPDMEVVCERFRLVHVFKK